MLKVKIFLVIAVLFFHPLKSFSCGNEYFITQQEIPLNKDRLSLKRLLFTTDDVLPYWHYGFGEDLYKKHVELRKKIIAAGVSMEGLYITWEELRQALIKNVDYKLLSDFAWYELRVGDKEIAIKLLEGLYEKHPKEYNIIANLGTAYEVTGKNEMALALLKKAVAINPASHHGSEWIHIRILEQKVKSKPNYTKIIDLGADRDLGKWLNGESYDKEISPDSLMIQIAYQLHERISFIPEPDPIVGQLVFDFADLVAIVRSPSEAKPFYRFAITYDSSLHTKEKQRVLAVEGKAAEVTIEPEVNAKRASALLNYIAVFAVVAGGIGLYFVSRKKRSSADKEHG
jgi:tetratricopeptide (TPR) repeat protein